MTKTTKYDAYSFDLEMCDTGSLEQIAEISQETEATIRLCARSFGFCLTALHIIVEHGSCPKEAQMVHLNGDS